MSILSKICHHACFILPCIALHSQLRCLSGIIPFRHPVQARRTMTLQCFTEPLLWAAGAQLEQNHSRPEHHDPDVEHQQAEVVL